jgi:putative hydroxymethylpyrimidine transporter CytX
MLLLWLGAAISISEIFTGGLMAPLGFGKGIAAILIGHVIGVAMLAFGGYISFARGENAMGAVAWSFGAGGGKLIAFCNMVQLLGWTIVMVVQAGSAVVSVFPGFPFALAALILSALVLLWALLFGSPAGRINDFVVILLSVLCLALLAEALSGGGAAPPPFSGGGLRMTLAIELSIAMPVSWLPLIGDYSLAAKDGICAAAMPFAGYFAGSALMYAFGLFIGIATGGDIFAFVAGSRFRHLACGVVLLSTLTTAFMDLYSAALSSERLMETSGGRTSLRASAAGDGRRESGRRGDGRREDGQRGRAHILATGLLAAAVSIFFPVERYADFLMGFLGLIGMVFVPVFTVIFLDFMLGGPVKKEAYGKRFHFAKLLIAAAGMLGYSLFSRYELGIPTLLSVLLVCALYLPFAFARGGEGAGRDKLTEKAP